MSRTLRSLVTLALFALLLWQGARILLLASTPVPAVNLPPVPRPSAAAARTSVPAGGSAGEGYEAVAAKNLFHPERRLVLEEPTPAPTPGGGLRQGRGETITLFGVLFDGASPRALVRSGQQTGLRSYRPGDEIVPGVVVKEITFAGMTVVEAGAERTIRVQGEATAQAGTGSAVAQPAQVQTPRVVVPRVTPRIPRTMRPAARSAQPVGPPPTFDLDVVEDPAD